MEIKGIDVSRWNGKINWKTVADYGMGFVILRITEKGNIVDSTFEYNYKECVQNKIPVGVYKYSYATSLSQIKEEANIVIKTLNKRKLEYPVFLDLEDKCQENISKDVMMQMINAFRDTVIKAGYKFGIYCGNYWYKTKLPEEAKKYDCWLAAYPLHDDGTLQERLRPENGIGWQYSSKATIPGINTPVDRNVFYKDYTKENVNSNNNSAKPQEGGKPMTIDQVISAMIKIAENEVGYLEKKTNSQLDSKTANAGYNNYTKYWRDVYSSYQTQPWCACFVSWVFMKAFGLNKAKTLLKHWPYVYCPTLGAKFTKYANPKKGDIVIFYRGGTFAHTGIVTKVEGDKFWTIEGNTSGASGIVANGGGVCRKSYYNSQLPGTKFCRPDYSIISSVNSSDISTTPTNPRNYLRYGDTGNDVKILQQKLNKVGMTDANERKLVEDGEFGSGTKYAVQAFQKKYRLEVDGIAGKDTISKLDAVIASQSDSNTLDFESFVGACTTDNTAVYETKTGTIKLKTYPKLNRGNLVDVISMSGNRYKIKIANKYTGWIDKTRIVTPDKLNSEKPSITSKYPFVGECTGNDVNVRKNAGTNYTNISGWPKLNKGNRVDVLGEKKVTDGKKWYKIKIAGKYTGYIRSDYIRKI